MPGCSFLNFSVVGYSDESCGSVVVLCDFKYVLLLMFLGLVVWRRRGDLVGIPSRHIQHTTQVP